MKQSFLESIVLNGFSQWPNGPLRIFQVADVLMDYELSSILDSTILDVLLNGTITAVINIKSSDGMPVSLKLTLRTGNLDHFTAFFKPNMHVAGLNYDKFYSKGNEVYWAEIVSYHLDRLLGLFIVAPTAPRTIVPSNLYRVLDSKSQRYAISFL